MYVAAGEEEREGVGLRGALEIKAAAPDLLLRIEVCYVVGMVAMGSERVQGWWRLVFECWEDGRGRAECGTSPVVVGERLARALRSRMRSYSLVATLIPRNDKHNHV